MTDIAARIALLEARTQISNLVYRYAQCIRRGEVEACADLFCADAVFEIAELEHGADTAPRTRNRLEGRASIADYLAASASRLRPCPVIHNLTVVVEGDSASANSVMETLLPVEHRIVGEYDDTFRFEERWVFASRRFTIFC